MQEADRVVDISDIQDELLQDQMFKGLRYQDIEDIPDDDSLEDFFASAETEISWADGGEVVASCVLAAAKLIESRLANSAASVSNKLDSRREKEIERILENPKALSSEKKKEMNGNKDIIVYKYTDDVRKVKEKLKEKKEKLKEKTEDVALKTTDGARQASLKMKENTEKITFGIRGTAAEAVMMLSERADEVDFAGKLCPNAEGKEAFNAAGKVAAAGFGAAALIYEAVYDTTRTVASKSCEVTADVTRHKYGESAGKLVENTGHTVGNALRTLHLLSQLNGASFGRAVARDAGKKKIMKKRSGVERSTSGSSSAGSVISHGASLSTCSTSVAGNNSELCEKKNKLAHANSVSSSCVDNLAIEAKSTRSKMKTKHVRSFSDNCSSSSASETKMTCSRSNSGEYGGKNNSLCGKSSSLRCGRSTVTEAKSTCSKSSSGVSKGKINSSNKKLSTSSKVLHAKSTYSRSNSRVSEGKIHSSNGKNSSSNSRSSTVTEKTPTDSRSCSTVSEEKSVRSRSHSSSKSTYATNNSVVSDAVSSHSKSYSLSSHSMRAMKSTNRRNNSEVKSTGSKSNRSVLSYDRKALKAIEHEPLLSTRNKSCPPLDDNLLERGRSATVSAVEPHPSLLDSSSFLRSRSATMSAVGPLPSSPQRFAV